MQNDLDKIQKVIYNLCIKIREGVVFTTLVVLQVNIVAAFAVWLGLKDQTHV